MGPRNIRVVVVLLVGGVAMVGRRGGRRDESSRDTVRHDGQADGSLFREKVTAVARCSIMESFGGVFFKW